MAVSNDTLAAQVQELTRRLNEIQPVITAVAPIATAGNATFLSGISAMPSPSSPVVGSTGGWDANTGGTWATGERGYINGLYDSLSTFYGWIRASGLA